MQMPDLATYIYNLIQNGDAHAPGMLSEVRSHPELIASDNSLHPYIQVLGSAVTSSSDPELSRTFFQLGFLRDPWDVGAMDLYDSFFANVSQQAAPLLADYLLRTVEAVSAQGPNLSRANLTMLNFRKTTSRALAAAGWEPSMALGFLRPVNTPELEQIFAEGLAGTRDERIALMAEELTGDLLTLSEAH